MTDSQAPTITPLELKQKLEAGEELVLLDVREPEEWDMCHIEGAVHIPMGSVPERVGELPRDKTIVCYCHHGGRSANVQGYLLNSRFPSVYNLVGGIHGWSTLVDPSVPTY